MASCQTPKLFFLSKVEQQRPIRARLQRKRILRNLTQSDFMLLVFPLLRWISKRVMVLFSAIHVLGH